MKELSQETILNLPNRNYSGMVYLYTPLCGTCQTASKILSVLEELLVDLPFNQINLNYAPELAKNYAIESVPCLLMFKNGSLIEKIYAFHSVPYLYEKVNKIYELKKVQ